MQFDYENKQPSYIDNAGNGIIAENMRGYQFPGTTDAAPYQHIHTDKITVEHPTFDPSAYGGSYPWYTKHIPTSESEKVFNQFRIEATNSVSNVVNQQIQESNA